MLQLFFIVSALVALSILLLGINIFVFGRKFPETEVGKNKNMIRLGLRCPQCEERIRYHKVKPVKINPKTLKTDWTVLKG
jgi:DNA-directed RNA polymerase subunit RPC12/RpoP